MYIPLHIYRLIYRYADREKYWILTLENNDVPWIEKVSKRELQFWIPGDEIYTSDTSYHSDDTKMCRVYTTTREKQLSTFGLRLNRRIHDNYRESLVTHPDYFNSQEYKEQKLIIPKKWLLASNLN